MPKKHYKMLVSFSTERKGRLIKYLSLWSRSLCIKYKKICWYCFRGIDKRSQVSVTSIVADLLVLSLNPLFEASNAVSLELLN